MKNLHIISNVDELKEKVLQFKVNKKTVGYVPTLGGIHKGHLRLIRFAKKKSDIVVVSIFLNPLVFGVLHIFKTLDTTNYLLITEIVYICFTKTRKYFPLAYGYCLLDICCKVIYLVALIISIVSCSSIYLTISLT